MSKPPAKRRRIELTLEDKISLIKESEKYPKPSQKSLSEKFGIGKTTVSDILKRKSEYLGNFENNDNLQKFRFATKSKHDNLNDLMWDWFRQARDKAIPISGPIIQEKALEFAGQLDIPDFKASNGWLEKFKARHSIKAFKVSGESAGVNLETVEDYRSRIPEICSEFEPCDIFNCNETGLYYRYLPDKTLNAKGTRVETISKCFNLCGFPFSSDDNSAESDFDVDGDNIPLNQLAKINSVAQIDPETLATFDQHVSIEDDSDDWEQALIETHSATAETATGDASDSDDDQTNELSDSEPDLTLEEILAFSKRLKKFALVKSDNFLDVAQDLNSKSETAILQRCLKKKKVSVLDFVKK